MVAKKQLNYSKVGNYFIAFLKVHPEISKGNRLIKLLVNFIYLAILFNLLSKLFSL